MLQFFKQAKKEEIVGQIFSYITNPIKLKVNMRQLLSVAPIVENYFSDEQRNKFIDFFLPGSTNSARKGIVYQLSWDVICKLVDLYAKYFNSVQIDNFLNFFDDFIYRDAIKATLSSLVNYVDARQAKVLIRLLSLYRDDADFYFSAFGRLVSRFEALKPEFLTAFRSRLTHSNHAANKRALFDFFPLNIFYKDKLVVKEISQDILTFLKKDTDRAFCKNAITVLVSLASYGDEQQKNLIFAEIIALTRIDNSFCFAIPSFIFDSAQRKQEGIDVLLENASANKSALDALMSLEELTSKQKTQILTEVLSKNSLIHYFNMNASEFFVSLLFDYPDVPRKTILDDAFSLLPDLGSSDYLLFMTDKRIFNYYDAGQKEQILSRACASRNNEIFQSVINLVDYMDDSQIEQTLTSYLDYLNSFGRPIYTEIDFRPLINKLNEEQKQRFFDLFFSMGGFLSHQFRIRWMQLGYLLDITNVLDKNQRKQILDFIFLSIIKYAVDFSTPFFINQFFPFLNEAERLDYLQKLIQIVQDETTDKNYRDIILEFCTSLIMTAYNDCTHEKDKKKKRELKSELGTFLLLISPNYTNEAYFLLKQMKIQLQRAEWAMSLEEFKAFVQSNQIDSILELLSNPLLQPFPIEAGFSPSIELQTNFIRLGCLYLKPSNLHILNRKLLQEDPKKGLLAKGSIGEALLAYELSLENQTQLQAELELFIPTPIRDSLEPLIAYFKPVKLNLPQERNYNRALKRLTYLNTQNEWYSTCNGKIDELINQVRSYKAKNQISLKDLTEILEDTCDLLLLKMPIEDYKAKAKALEKKAFVFKVMSGLMLGLAALVIAAALVVGIMGFIIPTVVTTVAAVGLIAGSGVAFFSKRKQGELAALSTDITESLCGNI